MEKRTLIVKRFMSILIDHVIITTGVVLIGMMVSIVFKYYKIGEHEFIATVIFLTIVLYLFKDIFNGQSIGKRVLKMKVVNDVNGEVAGKFRTILRNVFIVIWPIEVVFIFINPEKRLGDKLMKTKINYF